MLTIAAPLFASMLLLAHFDAQSSLRAAWHFDDCDPAAATFANATGTDFAGTKVGHVGCNIGKPGLAGVFRGTSSVEVADAAHALDVDGGAFSVVAWVRPRPGGVVAQRRGSWALSADGAGVRAEVQWACTTMTPCRLEIAGPPIGDRWAHVALVYRTSNISAEVKSLQLFIDGQLVASQNDVDSVWAPLPNRAPLVKIGTGAAPFRGSIDEVGMYGAALSQPQVAALASGTDERLRIVYSAEESYFLADPHVELGRVKQAGFNTIWAYFNGGSTPGTRLQFADACQLEGIAVISPSTYLNELAEHPAVIGFWTLDEPTVPIEEQRAAYLAVKARTSKRVFVVRTDLRDEHFRTLYAPNVQDVDAIDIYPYMAAVNPNATLDRAKYLLFTGVSALFLNRISDLDKSKISRYIPVLGSFVDVATPQIWLKGDTFGAHLFWNRLAGSPASHGVFLWNYPTTSPGSEYLIGLGQLEYPDGRQLLQEYLQFTSQAPSYDDLAFEYFTGRDLAEFATPGSYGISPYNLNKGSGRFGVTANPQGSTVDFVIPLRKGSGQPFQRLYASVQTVNDAGSRFDNVELTFAYNLPGQVPVPYTTWQLGEHHLHVPLVIDLPFGMMSNDVTARMQIRWNGRTSPYAAVMGAAFALE